MKTNKISFNVLVFVVLIFSISLNAIGEIAPVEKETIREVQKKERAERNKEIISELVEEDISDIVQAGEQGDYLFELHIRKQKDRLEIIDCRDVGKEIRRRRREDFQYILRQRQLGKVEGQIKHKYDLYNQEVIDEADDNVYYRRSIRLARHRQNVLDYEYRRNQFRYRYNRYRHNRYGYRHNRYNKNRYGRRSYYGLYR